MGQLVSLDEERGEEQSVLGCLSKATTSSSAVVVSLAIGTTELLASELEARKELLWPAALS